MMLKPYRYMNKDKKIKIFFEEEDGAVKQYITPQGQTLKAYAKQLSASQRNSAEGVKDGSSYEFVIQKRNISEDMLIEFDKGFGMKTYNIDAIDFLEFLNGEMYIRASEVNTKEYDEIRWA
ncbi:MAG: head-tail adaptor protein [Bacteroidales bacterium]|jgi:hypothetical protein|nr:head-tail adaptor protein [Bacteroidales bacterium]